MFLLWLIQLPGCGDQTPASVPQCARVGPVLLTLLFSPLVPLSYQVLHGSIYSFPLVKYSCSLSAGVLHALLCLKVYSWYIYGERYTPCLPTPPACCSPKCSHSFHKFEHLHFRLKLNHEWHSSIFPSKYLNCAYPTTCILEVVLMLKGF